MLSLGEILTFGVMAGLSPSPHTLFCMSLNSHEKGSLTRAFAGAIAADFCILVMALFFSSFLTMHPQLQLFLKFFSVFYLGYLASHIFTKTSLKQDFSQSSKFSASNTGFALISESFLIQLSNINPIIFWNLIFFRGLERKDLNHQALTMVFLALIFVIVVYSVKGIFIKTYSRLQSGLLRRALFAAFCISYVWKSV